MSRTWPCSVIDVSIQKVCLYRQHATAEKSRVHISAVVLKITDTSNLRVTSSEFFDIVVFRLKTIIKKEKKK